MTVITDELPVELPNADDGPCLSLYQPTHRRHPENVQDTIRFKNLVRILERSLRQKYPTREVRPLLEPLNEVGSQFDFWNHAQDGLAILRSPHILRIYRLQRPVAELAIVADSFHTKPLLRIVQSADRYQVLGLSRATVKLYEGNRYALDEIDLQRAVDDGGHDQRYRDLEHRRHHRREHDDRHRARVRSEVGPRPPQGAPLQTP